MPNLTTSERIGTVVGGRYEVRRLLGEGGFSSVFAAMHNVTGREVALKLLHPHLVTTDWLEDRLGDPSVRVVDLRDRVSEDVRCVTEAPRVDQGVGARNGRPLWPD